MLDAAVPTWYEVIVDPVTGEFMAQIGDVGVLLSTDGVETGGSINESTAAAASATNCAESSRRHEMSG